MTTVLYLLSALAFWLGGRVVVRKIVAIKEDEPCESCCSDYCSCADA
jgi:hypothetical protein